MATFTYPSVGSWSTALSTGLNSLGSGSSASSSAITPDGAPFLDIEVLLASYTPAAPYAIEIHVLPLQSDSNYADLVAGNPATLQDVIVVSTGASAKKGMIRRLDQPAVESSGYKIALVNQSGASLASSGNTVKYRTVGFQAT